MNPGRKKKAKPSCGWNGSLSCSTKTSHFRGMQYPGLCPEQVCLLKYLACHTCAARTQSCGIILVPVQASCSYPQRYPVTPWTGGAALRSVRSPLPHGFLETDSHPATAGSEHLCSGGRLKSAPSKRLLQEQEPGAAKRKWMKGSNIPFFPPSALTTSKFSTDLCQIDTLKISFK